MNNTRFAKDNFRWDGMYLNYVTDAKANPWGEFIARFKYDRRDRASFQKFLMANFTVEEYFAARKADLAPAEILRRKGWVSPRVAKMREIDAAWRKAAQGPVLTLTYV
jgi:hypothetical protein